MPRRPTSEEALDVARWFLNGYIERTDSQVHFEPRMSRHAPGSQGRTPTGEAAVGGLFGYDPAPHGQLAAAAKRAAATFVWGYLHFLHGSAHWCCEDRPPRGEFARQQHSRSFPLTFATALALHAALCCCRECPAADVSLSQLQCNLHVVPTPCPPRRQRSCSWRGVC